MKEKVTIVNKIVIKEEKMWRKVGDRLEEVMVNVPTKMPIVTTE